MLEKIKVDKRTKKDKILNDLQHGRRVDTYTAFKKYGATRLSGIIFNLRKEGYRIGSYYKTRKARDGSHCTWVEYKMEFVG